MNLVKIISFLLFQLISFGSFSSTGDSLSLIDDIRNFAFKTTAFYPKHDFFTQWTTEEKPYVYVYVSYLDSVKKPIEFLHPYMFYGTDETQAEKEELKLQTKGYSTFCYKTNANASALLNTRLISYPPEAIAFIIFHELIHNYLIFNNVRIPYAFNEALCDVIGNYGALEYSISSGKLDSRAVKKQIGSNEKIYRCLNYTISKITRNPDMTAIINASCQKKISRIMLKANSFQKDRFDYKVSTAFLLKNKYYSKHYFLLKKVFLKQKSINGLLEIMKKAPEETLQCEKYLMKYT